METKRAAILYRATEDAAQHVIAIVVAGKNAVPDREGEGPDVIGDDAEGNVDLFLVGFAGRAGLRQCRAVAFAAQLFGRGALAAR